MVIVPYMFGRCELTRVQADETRMFDKLDENRISGHFASTFFAFCIEIKLCI